MADNKSTHDAIASAALELFAAQGYAGTSVREIAEMMGLTKAGVSYHFPAKEDLLHYLVDPVLDAVDELIERSSGSGPGSPREVLASYLELMLEYRMQFAVVVNDPAVIHHRLLGARIDEQHRRLRALLVGTGAGPDDDVRAAAALGALRRPVLAYPWVDPGDIEDVVLDAAMAVLADVPSAPRRRPLRPRRPQR